MRKAVLMVIALFGTAPPALAAVSGVVLTVNLAPVAGATISAYRPETYEMRMRRLLGPHPKAVPTATATTDANGRFSIDLKERVAHVFIQSPAGAAAEIEAAGNDDVGRILLPTTPPQSMTVTSKGQAAAIMVH